MRVEWSNNYKNWELTDKVKVKDLLNRLGIDPLGYTIIDKGKEEVLTLDDYVDNSAVIELKEIISGG